MSFQTLPNFVDPHVLTTAEMNILKNNLLVLEGLPNRNVIINGDTTIDQRDSDTTPIVVGGTSTYGPDRWQGTETVTGGAFTLERASVSPPDGFDHYLRITSTANAAAGAGELAHIGQTVEGNNIKHFGFGQSWAKEITLSFWVRSSLAGVYVVNFRNDGANRSYNAEYTIDVADTWEFKTITLTADTAGTWLYDTGRGAQVKWDLGSGSNFVGAADSWLSANDFTTANQVDWIGTASATFDITGVQLELGNRATAFEHRSFGQELALCHRYFQVLEGGGLGNQFVAAGIGLSGVVAYVLIGLPNGQMRTENFSVNYNALANFDARTGTTLTLTNLTFSNGNNSNTRASMTVASGFASGGAAILQKGAAGILTFEDEL